MTNFFPKVIKNFHSNSIIRCSPWFVVFAEFKSQQKSKKSTLRGVLEGHLCVALRPCSNGTLCKFSHTLKTEIILILASSMQSTHNSSLLLLLSIHSCFDRSLSYENSQTSLFFNWIYVTKSRITRVSSLPWIL